MKTREDLIDGLKIYHSEFESENIFREQFLKLLADPRAFHRDHLPGHITGSAWIIDEQKESALLTHHAKLNRWLQPGGHADGEENVFNVALREAEEETGLINLTSILPGFFDIDVHTIPERKEMPEHLHYDIRFLLRTSSNSPLIISEESHALKWVKMETILEQGDQNDSIARMIQKVKTLF